MREFELALMLLASRMAMLALLRSKSFGRAKCGDFLPKNKRMTMFNEMDYHPSPFGLRNGYYFVPNSWFQNELFR
jgi:hypothetical protein